MRLLTKASLGLAILLVTIATAPAAKADPIVIQTGGFALQNLGNDGTGISGLDALIGAAASSSHTLNGAGSFIALLNPLTFTTGFTGANSGGGHAFTFSQLLTINGVTQTLNMAGRIDIGTIEDSIHILSAAPLTFNFNTFSVDVNVLPADIVGSGRDGGVFCGVLKADFTVRNNTNPVPEPATLSLLGLSLAGLAAKLRQRRKSLRS